MSLRALPNTANVWLYVVYAFLLEDILMLRVDPRTSLTRPACLLRKTEPLVMESCPLKESCPFFERAAGLLYPVFGR